MKETPDFKLLDDIPCGIADTDIDKFHHTMYAEILRDIFLPKSIRPGISVGLFGKWGQGKSTVVYLLKKLLPENIKVVVFNAWKSRGKDSVRRQLLLKIIKEINPDKYKKISRFSTPELPMELRSYEEQDKYSDNKLWWLLTTKEKIDPWITVALITALLLLAISIYLFIKGISSNNLNVQTYILWCVATLFGLIISCITVVFRWFKNRKKQMLLAASPISDSQRLKYPEQFQLVFENEVKEYCKQGKKIIIVVDDIDRCDPNTVIEALAAIRQFSPCSQEESSENINCQFLIPCDENQVVTALEADGFKENNDSSQYHDYHSDERLRKFFDIIIHMDSHQVDELVLYAADLAKTINIDPDIARDIVELSNPQDPRAVKKLLNAYKIAKAKIKNMQKNNKLPATEEMPCFERTLITLIALREITPKDYEIIKMNPILILNRTIDKTSDSEISPRGKSILNIAGEVNHLTAAYLIRGRYERELHGNKESWKFLQKFEEKNATDLKNVISIASPDEQRKYLSFMKSQVKKQYGDIKLRELLSLFVNYAVLDSSSADFIKPCIEKIIELDTVLEKIMKRFQKYEELLKAISPLPINLKNRLFWAVFNNFKSTNDSNEELRFLFFNANEFEPKLLQTFKSWMLKYIEDGRAKNERDMLGVLMKTLPKDSKKFYGFLPDAGLLFCKTDKSPNQQWNDDSVDADESTWPHLQIIPTFVGNNIVVANKAIQILLSKDGPLASLTDLSKPPLGYLPAWKTIGALCKVLNSEESVTGLFSLLWGWLNAQSTFKGRLIILEEIAPILLLFQQREIIQLASYIGNSVINQAEGIDVLDWIGAKPKDKNKQEKWILLTEKIFNSIVAQLQTLSSLNVHQQELLKKIALLKWPIEIVADQILSTKIKNIPVTTLEVWIEFLLPLMRTKRENSGSIIRKLLTARQRIKESLKAGKSILWENKISADDATIIVAVIGDKIGEFHTLSDELSKLTNVPGATKIFENLVDLHRGFTPDELHQRFLILKYVAAGINKCSQDYKIKFQEIMRKMFITDKTPIVLEAIDILSDLDSLDKKFIRELKQKTAETKDDSIRKKLEELLRKQDAK